MNSSKANSTMNYSGIKAPLTVRAQFGRYAAIIALALGSAATSQAAFILVDDFQSYSIGNIGAASGGNPGNSTAFTPNDGPWNGWDGTGTIGGSLIGISADGSDNYLRYGWASTGFRGAYLNTIPSIADMDSGAYYFQARRSAIGGDVSYGLTDGAAPTDFFNDFNVEVSLVENGSTFDLTARNGASTEILASGLTTNQWYDIWLYVNNATDTFDVYFGTTGDPDILGTLVGEDLAFGNTTSNSLVTFATIHTSPITNNSAHLNNLYFTPEPTPATLLALGLVSLIARRRRK